MVSLAEHAKVNGGISGLLITEEKLKIEVR